MDKIKLVVFNEHTLGYILPELPNYVQILHASVLRGSTSGLHESSVLIGSLDKIRLAGANDFNMFRVSFKGFNNSEEYEYDTKQ